MSGSHLRILTFCVKIDAYAVLYPSQVIKAIYIFLKSPIVKAAEQDEKEVLWLTVILILLQWESCLLLQYRNKMTNPRCGVFPPKSPVMKNAAQSGCSRGNIMTMDSLWAFERCHITTLLCCDLVLNLSQYFTQQDKVAEVGALFYT